MPQTGSTTFDGCVASFDGTRLIIGNDRIRRTWRLEGGDLLAESLRDEMTGREWCARATAATSAVPADAEGAVDFSTATGIAQIVEAPSLVATLTIAPHDGTRRTHRFRIFPSTAAISQQLTAEEPLSGDVIDRLEIDPLHVALTQVILRDQTDFHDNLVSENRWLLYPAEEVIRLSGNLFFLEHQLSGHGLIFLKLAPLPRARPIKAEADLHLTAEGACELLGHGIPPEGGSGYELATICYHGGRAGRIAALHCFQRQLRPYVPGRDGLLVSNTWGDRSGGDRVSETFMLREIDAAKKLGVEVVQIDDGWQRGTQRDGAPSPSGSGIWTGFWKLDERFWEPHPDRFPNGLQPVVEAARRDGVRVGLWYVPDSSDDFANWQRDAHKLLELHGTLGIDSFKIDGVKMHTPLGQANLHRLYDHVLRESNGHVTLDQDVTAAVRPGYFGQVRAGPIFVENRYTDWHRYWPHRVLRNLWLLSQFIDPVRLRMEFLNNARNGHLYENDPLAPASYEPDYLFASVIFASPLAWFEVSNLPPAYVEKVAPLVRLWKQHRERIRYGRTIAIGDEPDGTSWTGFSSDEDGRHGYLLIFRELNDRQQCEIEVPTFTADAYRVAPLAGEGEVLLSRGRATVTIPRRLRFLWAEVETLR